MKKIRLILFALLGVVLFPMYASATTIFSQTSFNDNAPAHGTGNWVAKMGTGSSATMVAIDVYIGSWTDAQYTTLDLQECSDNTYTSCTHERFDTGYPSGYGGAAGSGVLKYTLSSPYTLNATKYYAFFLGGIPSLNNSLKGSNTNGLGGFWGSACCSGTATSFTMYFNAYDSGGATPPNITTRFIDLLLPQNGTTTPSGSVEFAVQYYFNNSTHDFNQIGVSILRGDQLFTGTSSFDTIINGQNTFDKTISLGEGGYYLWRAIMQGTGSSTPLYSEWKSFYTVSNPYPTLIGTTSPTLSFGLATSTCSFTNISGCFQNALMFVFYPSHDVLDLFAGLKDQIAKKPPFGYFALLQGKLGSISSTSTPTFSITIPTAIQTRLFDPIKNGLVIVIWLMWGVHLFHKLRNIKI